MRRADAMSAAAVRHAQGAADVALARGLFEEYAAWLAVDLCFQGFAQELATLPGAYAPPRGRLLLAGPAGDAFGCIALRPLGEAAGEVKRLYVQPRARGGGWGRRLANALIDEARAIGYRELKLDTLARMTQARALYARLGFAPCPAYYHNPLGDTIYMRLALDAPAPVPDAGA
ncbi:MAG: N-acetyltransferase [Betaproteobacteria bacterium]|nr:MAG: N-acetyltransferase [Betaproteobacteria bacterium]